MKIQWVLSAVLLSLSFSTFAAAPACLDSLGNSLGNSDSQVAQWKTSTPNQFTARALVHGTIQQIYPDENGHNHFEIILDDHQTTLEVIYNISFGALPQLQAGEDVKACGDYITSTAPSGHYVASPDGAIIHWIHKNPNPKPNAHPSGFLEIDGVVYGQQNGN